MAGLITSLALIFGGCCCNALSLEQITTQYPKSGTLVTFAQFLVITLVGFPGQLEFKSRYPRLRPRIIPIAPYMAQVTLFFSISMINNMAFAYHVPMTVHILFRSAGLVVNLILGWCIGGRRYSTKQVLAVLSVTCGVIVTTLSASPPSDFHLSSMLSNTYVKGIALLSVALLLSGFLGLVQDWTFQKYGNKHKSEALWKESAFYLHFLAMPMFVFVQKDISAQMKSFRESQVNTLGLKTIYAHLVANTVTQLFCVSGVNRLTGQVSSLTVTLTLAVRKVVSLMISVALFGRSSHELWLGAFLVFAGTYLYTFDAMRSKARVKEKVT